MAGLFSSGKSSTQQTPSFEKVYDPFEATRAKLNEFLSQQIGKSGPKYSGDRVAPISDIEQASLDKAKELAAKPSTGPLFQAASEEAKKTLSGEYDPSTSPYYQAVKAESERNLQKTQDYIKDEAAGGRRYYGGVRLEQQREAATDNTNNLNTVLGTLAENERNRMTSLVPVAASLDNQELLAPAKQAQALQVIGALPRELQQAYLDALYQDFYQSEYEYPLNIAQIASGPGQQQPMFVQSGYTQPGSFASQFNQFAGPAAMLALELMK